MIGFLRSGVSPMPKVRLDGPRVFLRPPRPRDWKAWSALRSESRDFLKPWEPSWPADALTRGAFLRRIRRQAADWHNDQAYSFLVFSQIDRALLGGIGLSNVRRGVAQMASLGYWIGEKHARQGYMTEGVFAVLAFAFRHLGLHRVEAVCLPSNEASRNLLLTTGFREEGCARAYLRIDGQWRDHVFYGILREDFGLE